jgi:hypothetical protein
VIYAKIDVYDTTRIIEVSAIERQRYPSQPTVPTWKRLAIILLPRKFNENKRLLMDLAHVTITLWPAPLALVVTANIRP